MGDWLKLNVNARAIVGPLPDLQVFGAGLQMVLGLVQ